MQIRKTRQILKALAEDTRLRIVNLLKEGKLNVTDICEVLGKKQSTVSKHLTRLRLTGIVIDKRSGNNVYYLLNKSKDKEYVHFLDTVIKGLSDIEVFRKDEKKLSEIKKKTKSK